MTDSVSVPRALVGQPPLRFDISSLNIAEGRIHEVAIVNASKAPELLSAFNRAYSDSTKVLAQLRRELTLAKRESDKVKSIVLIDKVPTFLALKGLATPKNPMGSEDLRRAVLDQDDEYRAVLDRVTMIACVLELVEGKQKAIEMAFSSVKKIVGESRNSWLDRRSLSAGNEADAGVGDVVDSYSGFGKASY